MKQQERDAKLKKMISTYAMKTLWFIYGCSIVPVWLRHTSGIGIVRE
jgi:hypothetical protein